VTASFAELSGPRRSLAAVLRRSISRDEFFAGLYILGCGNGLVGRIIYSVNLEGWTGAITGIDINVIVLFAVFAGLWTILGGDEGKLRAAEPVRTVDFVVGAAFLIPVSLPIFALSWVAVTGLSLYILLFANLGASSARARGAIILLALTLPMLWSRLLFQFFAPFILKIDAWLAATLLGTDRVGNLVGFADRSGYMVVTPACSSFGNLSFALLCWVSVTQWTKHRWRSIDLLWCTLAAASVVTANVVRICLTGLSRSSYEAIHNPTGEMVTGTVMLGLVVGFSILGARRELLSRA
jgi:exosortase/archaeosortase family protein